MSGVTIVTIEWCHVSYVSHWHCQVTESTNPRSDTAACQQHREDHHSEHHGSSESGESIAVVVMMS